MVSAGLRFSERSLALDSATEASSLALRGGLSLDSLSLVAESVSSTAGGASAEGDTSTAVGLESSVSLLTDAPIGLLDGATTVVGSAESSVLNIT